MKTITKMFDRLVATKTEGQWGAATGAGYRPGPGAFSQGTWVNDSYIDLAGLAQGEKTVMVKAATVQRGTYQAFVPAVAGDRIYIYDIMTSIPVDIDKLSTVIDIFNRGLGMLGTELNFEHVLYHRLQVFSYDVDFANGTAVLADESQCGSLMPTASDRIYCYRIVSTNTDASPETVLGVAPARYVLEVDVKEEAEYEYLMRLKRSYDLQQAPDRD